MFHRHPFGEPGRLEQFVARRFSVGYNQPAMNLSSAIVDKLKSAVNRQRLVDTAGRLRLFESQAAGGNTQITET